MGVEVQLKPSTLGLDRNQVGLADIKKVLITNQFYLYVKLVVKSKSYYKANVLDNV